MAVPLDYPIIDCDSHLSEDLDRLRALIDAKFRHLAPRMMDQGHGEMFVLAGN